MSSTCDSPTYAQSTRHRGQRMSVTVFTESCGMHVQGLRALRPRHVGARNCTTVPRRPSSSMSGPPSQHCGLLSSPLQHRMVRVATEKVGPQLGHTGKITTDDARDPHPSQPRKHIVPARKLVCNFVTRVVRETPLLREQDSVGLGQPCASAFVTPAADAPNPFSTPLLEPMSLRLQRCLTCCPMAVQ